MQYQITERLFHFLQPAGTSRGVYTTRRSWMVVLTDSEGNSGVGECAPLPDLSCDVCDDYAQRLETFCQTLCRQPDLRLDNQGIPVVDVCDIENYPSIRFGLETALLHLHRRSTMLFDTPFGRGEEGIPINGLVWMGTYDEMLQRLQTKIDQGFHCVKLKIGAIDFDRELELIRLVRSHFSVRDIELRVDANGGFSPEEAMKRLEQLARYDLHSIEQPIRQHQWTAMASLCQHTPLPIALDEELIGINSREEKERLLDALRPQLLVLKPSLHGGMEGTREWVDLARERNMGSWITSALESNVGLNAVAHLSAHIYGPHITFPQGLGTGQLYADNIPMPLQTRGEKLWALDTTSMCIHPFGGADTNINHKN